MMQRVLNSAQNVTFQLDVEKRLLLFVASMKRPNIRSVYFPKYSVHIATLSTFLSNCPQLEILKFDGEPLGLEHIYISHPTLRMLDIECRSFCPFTIHRPNLTHLCTYDGTLVGKRDVVTTSLFCPLLTNVCLAAIHSAPAVLEFMAIHALNIEVLEFSCGGEERIRSLTNFKSVHFLGLINYEGVAPFVFEQCPLLDTLELNSKKEVGVVDVQHQRLRVLVVSESTSSSSVALDCPSLEKLYLKGTNKIEKCLEGLNSSCPKLKCLGVDMAMFEGNPIDAYHETLEEMRMSNLSRGGVRLVCLRLTTLSLSIEIDNIVLPNIEAHCPNLKELGICNYQNPIKLPALLNLLPVLESLCISNSIRHGSELVLVHPHVHKVWIARSIWLPMLFLSMPNLGESSIYESHVAQLSVASKKSVTLEPTAHGGSACGEKKRVFKREELLTLEIRHENRMLKVVHGDDTLWIKCWVSILHHITTCICHR